MHEAENLLTEILSWSPQTSIGIVGAGNMGASIAVAVSILGVPVYLIDTNSAVLQTGLGRIDKIFSHLATKSGQDMQGRRALIKPVENYDQLREAQLIIEAVTEDIEVKKSVLQTLDQICRPETILASNTSSLSITQLASFTNREQQIIGLHFFNPAHLMQLVEVIPGIKSAPQVVDFAVNFVKKLDKFPVKVEECASFLVNRLLGRYINEAIWVLQDGLADVKTIDAAACKLLMPIGPLQLRDMNGLDIGLSVSKVNYAEYGERYKPPLLLEKMVELNMLGKKSQSGFYKYDQESRKPSAVNNDLAGLVQPKKNLPAFEPLQLFLPMMIEAFLVLQEKIVAPADIDLALRAGLGMRKGLMEFAFDYGLPNCLSKIESLYLVYGERFRPAPLLKRYVWAGQESLLQV